VLNNIEARLSWQPQDHLPLRDRILKIGNALLSLKESEYLGAPQSGPLGERLSRLLARVFEPLEREWNTGRGDPDTMARIKRLRTAILPGLVQGDLDEKEKTRRWRQLTDLYFAQQLHCYSGEYLDGTPTPERLLETVERYEEDLTDEARPHPPLHGIVTIGEAIEASPERERGTGGDPLAEELQRRLETMLEETKSLRRKPASTFQ
jgi:hypothetical protein